MFLLKAYAISVIFCLASCSAEAESSECKEPNALLGYLSSMDNSTVFVELLQKFRVGRNVGVASTCDSRYCSMQWDPFCSIDNVTYGNPCEAESCNATLACRGECPCALREQPGVQDAACPTVFNPVCTQSNINFRNACLALRSGEEVACNGECPCEVQIKPLSNPEVEYSKCEQAVCPMIFLPQCGKDGITYSNECLAKACKVEIACPGECPCSDESSNRRLLSDELPKPLCPTIFDPVCDVMNKTHTNICEANNANAPLACLGNCPCDNLLQQVVIEGGAIMVPTDDVISQLLGNYEDLMPEQLDKEVAHLLASMLTLNPKLDVHANGSRSQSQAGNILKFTTPSQSLGSDVELLVADLDAGLEFGITGISYFCDVAVLEANKIGFYNVGIA